MKKKYFGNTLDEDDYIDEELNTSKYDGERTEFLVATDRMSARQINRAIRNRDEDQENEWEIIQTLIKTLYGENELGAIPDIYEEMDGNKLAVGSFFSNSGVYIRLPTGAFFARLNNSYYQDNKYKLEEDNTLSRALYIDSDHNAAVIFNRPNLELFERECALHFNMNLDDEDNNFIAYVDCYDEDEEYTVSRIKNGESVLEKRTRPARKCGYYATYKRNVYTSTEEGRIPSSGYYSNVFTFVKAIEGAFGNYFTNKTDFFSLEEMVEVKSSWTSGEYVIFFNPHTTEELDTDNISLSYSKRFGICTKDYFDNYITADNGIILYVLDLDISNAVGGGIKVVISSFTSKVQKINRSTLSLKNLEAINTINKMVMENVDGSYNFSNAHIAPSSTEEENIAIGPLTLGYPQINGVDQDPTEYEQALKSNLGSYNIAIGPEAMRNTTGSPERNIAIGHNALINIQNGTDNIEIGMGTGTPTATVSLLNIGDNILGDDVTGVTISEENIVMGHKNLYQLSKLGEDNVILGNYNTTNSKQLTSYTETNRLSNSNVVIGNYNKLNNIGNYNTIVGVLNNNATSGDYNLIFGNSNTSKDIGNKNIIIGNNNADVSTDDTSALSDEVMFGDSNVILGSGNISTLPTVEMSGNFLLGIDNNSESSDNYVYGKRNTLKASKEVHIFGDDNAVSNTSDSSDIIGRNNTISSNNNFVIGDNNTVSLDDNFVMGDKNTVSSTGNIVIGDNNNTNAKTGTIVINNNQKVNYDGLMLIGGNFNADSVSEGLNNRTNQLILGPLTGMPYYKNYTIETENMSASFMRINGNSDATYSAEIFMKNMLITGKQTTFTGSATANYYLRAEKYLTQSLAASNMTVSSEEAVPCAGTLSNTVADSAALQAKLADSKSFEGTVAVSDSGWQTVSSIRHRNGNGDGPSYGSYIRKPFATMSNGGHAVICAQNAGTWDKEYQLLDSYGDQTIEKNLTINGTNGLVVTNGGVYGQTIGAASARALKKDIADTKHTSAIDEINKIKIVDFFYKTDEYCMEPKIGFIADDTDEIFASRKHDKMDINNCIGMLLKATQELSAENKELREKLEKLENDNKN